MNPTHKNIESVGRVPSNASIAFEDQNSLWSPNVVVAINPPFVIIFYKSLFVSLLMILLISSRGNVKSNFCSYVGISSNPLNLKTFAWD